MQDLPEKSFRESRMLKVTVVVSFVLLLTAAALTLRISRQADEADQWVVHTLEIKQQMAELETALASAESGQRGFLITRDESFLRPFEAALVAAPQLLEKLRAATKDNASQLRKLDEVVLLIDARLETIAQTLELTRQGRNEDAVRIVRTRGSHLMNDIRARLHDLDAIETRLLAERRGEAAELRNEFTAAVTAMLIACAVLTVLSLLGVRRYVASIDENQRRLAQYNAELEAKVAERTLELAQSADLATRERNRAETLLIDVNHRVGNNLALVSSFLTMQQRTLRNPEAARALDAARTRVQAIASAHRKLRLGADFASVKANEVIGAVLDDICAGLPPGDAVRVNYDLAPLEINARDAVSLGVLTSELVMNAIKHAFAPGEGGEIRVVFASAGAHVPYLEVTDDGRGWHEKNTLESGGPGSAGQAATGQGSTGQGSNGQGSTGLGAKIIDMLARQFGGAPQRSPGRDDAKRPGTRIRIELARIQLMPSSA